LKGGINILYQKFAELLSKSGKKVSQVSKETGISESVFSTWKNRNGGLSAENLYKVAKYFDVPIEFFLEKGGDD
jgi:transcriptional regulator with XRE-family HTH domain